MTTPNNETTVLSTYRTDLTVKLHPEEVHDYAKRLAQIEQEMAQHQERAKSIKADLAAQEAKLKAERSTVAMKVRTEAEVRQVPCTITAHWATNRAITSRDDTGEVIAERPLAAAERQAVMNIGQAAGIASSILDDAKQAAANEKPAPVLGEVARVPCTAACLAGLCTVHGSECPDKGTIEERTARAKGGGTLHRMPIHDVTEEEPDEEPDADDADNQDQEPDHE